MLCYYYVKFVIMKINRSKLLVTSFVAHSNVSYHVPYHGPCIELCIVSLGNVLLQPLLQLTSGKSSLFRIPLKVRVIGSQFYYAYFLMVI